MSSHGRGLCLNPIYIRVLRILGISVNEYSGSLNESKWSLNELRRIREFELISAVLCESRQVFKKSEQISTSVHQWLLVCPLFGNFSQLLNFRTQMSAQKNGEISPRNLRSIR